MMAKRSLMDFPTDGRMRGLMRQPMLLMVLLIFLSFMVALVTLCFIASDLNQQEARQNRLLLDKALQTRQEVMQFHLSDNAEWGEAYQNLHRTLNTDWAWTRQNLGESLFQTFAYEGVFVIAPRGDTVYSVIDGQLQQRDFTDWLGRQQLPALRQQLQHNDGKALSRFVVVNQQLVLLCAAWITTGGDNSVPQEPGPPSLMIA